MGPVYAHYAPVQKAQDGGRLYVGDARHRRQARHIRDAAEVVQSVYREGAMLAVKRYEVKARPARKLYQRGRGKRKPQPYAVSPAFILVITLLVRIGSIVRVSPLVSVVSGLSAPGIIGWNAWGYSIR